MGPILDTFEHFKDTGMHLRVDRFAVLGPLGKHSQLPGRFYFEGIEMCLASKSQITLIYKYNKVLNLLFL